jgi:hypothetical protein
MLSETSLGTGLELTRPNRAGNCGNHHQLKFLSSTAGLGLTYCLLLGKVARGTEHDDDGVVLELHCARISSAVSFLIPHTKLGDSRLDQPSLLASPSLLYQLVVQQAEALPEGSFPQQQ